MRAGALWGNRGASTWSLRAARVEKPKKITGWKRENTGCGMVTECQPAVGIVKGVLVRR